MFGKEKPKHAIYTMFQYPFSLVSDAQSGFKIR